MVRLVPSAGEWTASIHDWIEGRGEPMVSVNRINDATSRVLSGFYKGETVEAHFDLLAGVYKLSDTVSATSLIPNTCGEHLYDPPLPMSR